MVKATNLELRGDSFYASVHVPPKLRPVIGRKVFRKCLHTKDTGEALRQRADAVAELRARLAALVKQADATGRFPGAADWLAHQVERHKVKVAELERTLARERETIRWALEQVRTLRPDHPAAAPTEQVPSFRQCAEKCIAAKAPTWKKDRWSPLLASYVFPRIGDTPVNEIDTPAVLSVLEPLWSTRTVTAVKLRGAIESILDHAKARGWRTGENVAAWGGHLEHVLAKPRKVAPVKNHPALPWKDAPAFMARLRSIPGHAARALEFTILTASRTQESVFAECKEIDLDAKVWHVPPARMKRGKAHRVPLAAAVLALIDQQPSGRYLFPGSKGKSGCMSHMALVRLLRQMGYSPDAVSVHGFRSTFRDWCLDNGHDEALAEHALAHVRGDATVRAYARSDALERRRVLMQQWSEFCTSGTV